MITQAKKSKIMDMKCFWLQDRKQQDHFQFYWKPGKHNLADPFTNITWQLNIQVLEKYATNNLCVKVLHAARSYDIDVAVDWRH